MDSMKEQLINRSPSPGPVLVTGAGSGIGLHLTRRLAELGHRVFATARKARDLEALARIDGAVPLELDVTRPEQVVAALRRVEEVGPGLYGLINNAGVGDLGGLDSFSDAELAHVFEVNVFGPHRMTTACVRLLIASGGRIVNIGSQGGLLSKPFFGPYTMTKHALEAYSVALAGELEPHGVRVSIVQPGGIVSEMGAKSLPSTLARLERAQPPFDVAARALLEALRDPPEPECDEPESETNRKPSSPEIVAVAVFHALFAERPRPSYLVGTRWEGDRVVHSLIERLLQANDCPSLRYTRDELVAFLDQQLAERSQDY